MDDEKPTAFFADPVDEHGNVIATAWMSNVTICGRPVDAVKVPHNEIVLDPERTIHVNLADLDDDPPQRNHTPGDAP